MRLKVGILGFGKMGKIRYDAIQRDGRGIVVGGYDTDKSRIPSDIKIYDTPEALIQDPAFDAVFVCTPNFLNKPFTCQSLLSGKHVFCEKPPCLNSSQMLEIIEAEKASGKKLMYGLNHRHHDSIKQAKEFVDSGAFGRVLWMRGRYGKSVDEKFYKDWRSQKELSGGGILIDQGIHMLDLFLMFGGDFEETKSFVSQLYWDQANVEDNVFAILRNKEGMVASLHSTMTQWRHLFSFEVFLSKGHITINGLITPSRSYGEEVLNYVKNRSPAPAATWTDLEQIYFKVDNSWDSEIRLFFNAILENHPIEMGNSEDSLKLMRLVDRIYAEK